MDVQCLIFCAIMLVALPAASTDDDLSEFKWVPHEEGFKPEHVIEAGVDGKGNKLCIGRAEYAGGLLPAAVYCDRGEAEVVFYNKAHKRDDFEWLVAEPGSYRWVEDSYGGVPKNTAIVGGHSSSKETLYIGRYKWKDEIYPAKIHPSTKAAWYAWKGSEYETSEYEVLIRVLKTRTKPTTTTTTTTAPPTPSIYQQVFSQLNTNKQVNVNILANAGTLVSGSNNQLSNSNVHQTKDNHSINTHAMLGLHLTPTGK